MMSEPSGKDLFSVTSELAPTMLLRPIEAPLRTVLPIPMTAVKATTVRPKRNADRVPQIKVCMTSHW